MKKEKSQVEEKVLEILRWQLTKTYKILWLFHQNSYQEIKVLDLEHFQLEQRQSDKVEKCLHQYLEDRETSIQFRFFALWVSGKNSRAVEISKLFPFELSLRFNRMSDNQQMVADLRAMLEKQNIALEKRGAKYVLVFK